MSDERHLAKFIDLDLVAADVDEKQLSPMEIVGLVFAAPVSMEKGVVYNRTVPLDKPLEIDISTQGLGVMNKVTPELLLGVVANIIATSPNAAVAVAKLRNEVLMWKFERADGTVE